MGKYSEVFVAFDVAKKKHAVAIAEGGRTGEVRFLGDVENSPLPIERTIKRLADRYDRLHVCFEAGPTGYGLYRQIQALGHECMVVAPALIPKRSGERIKTNRRDAVTLARLHRAGELTGVWAPDAAHEAVRDLVRAREAAADDLRRKRQQLLSFLLRHAGFTAEAAIGRWRIGAGLPARSSNMPRSKSSFRKPSTRSRTRSNACVGSRSNSLSSCRNGRWRRSWKPTRRCVAPRFSYL
jgi:transposase